MSADLSQNELFQLMGEFLPYKKSLSQMEDVSVIFSEEVNLACSLIEDYGLCNTSEKWQNFRNPVVSCFLKLAASGMSRESIKSIIETSISMEQKTGFHVEKNIADLERLCQMLDPVLIKGSTP